jgi:hypothetical protein
MLHISNGPKEPMQLQQDLLKFPPILRRVAQVMAKSEEILNMSQAAEEAGVSANAVRVATFRAKRKGNNFNELLNKICNEKLIAYRPQVIKSLVEEAKKGSAKHQELFFRLCGDLKNEPKVGQNVHNSLTFVLAMPSELPEKIGAAKADPIDSTPDPED